MICNSEMMLYRGTKSLWQRGAKWKLLTELEVVVIEVE